VLGFIFLVPHPTLIFVPNIIKILNLTIRKQIRFYVDLFRFLFDRLGGGRGVNLSCRFTRTSRATEQVI
jgi:hypothetical protein